MASELAKALAAFQLEIPAVPKASQADTGVYKYDYAPLEDITAKAMPLLAKHGLSYTCLPGTDDHDRLILDYALLHESGEEKAGRFPLWMVLPEKFKAQILGGLITYFRRYCLLAVTGVAPGGDDNDGADGAEVDAQRPLPAAANGHRTQAPGADMWDEVRAEERPGSALPADLTGIQRAYIKLGFDTRADRQEVQHISAQLVGRDLNGPVKGQSHKNLTFHEAKQLRGELEGFPDRAALVERVTGSRAAAEAMAAQDAAEDTQEAQL